MVPAKNAVVSPQQEGGAPAVGWRAGVHGSREGPYDTQWVDNLLLSSGALRSAAEVAADTTYYGPYCPGN